MAGQYCRLSGWFFAPGEREALFARIKASGAKLVTVAMGSPRQEILMQECKAVYPQALYMGVGGTYDVYTGQVKRAPEVWQKWGWNGCTDLFCSRHALVVS